MSRVAGGRSGALAALALACVAAGCGQSPRTAATAASDPGDGLRLSPDPAFATSNLVAVLAPDAPDPGTLRFEWRRNGRQIDGASGPTLEPSRFTKGDRIAVWVTLPATEGRHARELTAATTIANTPPRVASVEIELENATDGPALRAAVECADPDGDRPWFDYRWTVNGEPVKGASGARLPAAALARGDRVAVAVVAHDPDSQSLEATATFAFENRPPAFTSQPAAPRPGDAAFEYRATATDPDGDALKFALAQGPAGMTVGPDGDVRWPLPAGDARRGEFPVRLRATDEHGGEAVQEFTIRL